jgi:glucose uptake protein
MFQPQSFTAALLMMVASTICWGSWANAYKSTKNYRFELFYWDYAAGIVVISLLLAFTFGSVHHDSSSFLANTRAADASNIGLALVGGAIFNVANLLLVAGIEMAGLAVAFPVSIGIALVVGVMLSYALQPKGQPILLAAGVACALVAVVLDGVAYANLPGARAGVSKKSLVVSVISGLLMGSFAPFVTRALTVGRALGPYSIDVFFTFGALLSCFVVNTYFMRRPRVGPAVAFRDYLAARAADHVLGLLGGFIWGLGTVFNFVAASFTGVAIAYAIGQASPMVAAFWGVFLYKEFAGAGGKAKTFMALMFLFYLLALFLVAQAYRTM